MSAVFDVPAILFKGAVDVLEIKDSNQLGNKSCIKKLTSLTFALPGESGILGMRISSRCFIKFASFISWLAK